MEPGKAECQSSRFGLVAEWLADLVNQTGTLLGVANASIQSASECHSGINVLAGLQIPSESQANTAVHPNIAPCTAEAVTVDPIAMAVQKAPSSYAQPNPNPNRHRATEFLADPAFRAWKTFAAKQVDAQTGENKFASRVQTCQRPAGLLMGVRDARLGPRLEAHVSPTALTELREGAAVVTVLCKELGVPRCVLARTVTEQWEGRHYIELILGPSAHL